jgi:hypothetical protein
MPVLPGACFARTGGVIPAGEFPIGNIMQQSRKFDHNHVGVFVPADVDGIFPNALYMEPIMTRAFTGELGLDKIGSARNNFFVGH